MDYVITNKRQYIKLGENGVPITCSKQEAQRFENSKAKNILGNLPKTMKKFHFRCQAVPEIKSTVDKNIRHGTENKIIQKNIGYEVTENITRWKDKFGECSDTIIEAQERQKFLCKELKNVDDELLDILHIIEMEAPKNMYQGWLLYKKIRDNRKRRRPIKDEITILQDVLEEVDAAVFSRKRIQKAIDGLFKRKYKFRIVEEEEKDAV